MNQHAFQRACAWSGIICFLLFFLGFFLANFVPPLVPDLSAEAVASHYQDSS